MIYRTKLAQDNSNASCGEIDTAEQGVAHDRSYVEKISAILVSFLLGTLVLLL